MFEICVADNGTGMSSEVLTRVFEPFFTTKSQSEGTGLGMATVYGIVEQSRGGIDIRSVEGDGTQVSVYLPMLTESEARAGSSPREPEETVRQSVPIVRGRVLLVEDDEMLRRLSTRTLESSGFEVVSAADGEQGLEAARRLAGAFDILVTDMVMPKRTGRELANKVLEFSPEMKVLMMSGYTEELIAGEGTGRNLEHLLQKPFSPKELVCAVASMLD